MKRLLAPVLILTATLATVSATTAQEVSPISLSSTVIVVGHGEPVIASVAPRTSCPGELAVAWYVPRDVTAALQDGNLVEVVTTPLHDGRATLTQDEVGEWLGQRLYGRVEGSSCTLLGWAQLDVAYVDAANNALAPATVVFPADLLDLPAQNPPGSTLGGFLGAVTAFADGAACATIDLATDRAPGEDAIFRLGQDGQPEACRTEGAIVTFEASLFIGNAASPLYERMTLLVGVTQTLRNFGTVPDSDAGNPTPGAPDLGSPALISEVPAGQVGNSGPAWWFAAAALVTVLTVGTIVARRRH